MLDQLAGVRPEARPSRNVRLRGLRIGIRSLGSAGEALVQAHLQEAKIASMQRM